MSVAALSQRLPRTLDERMELEGIIRTDASFEEYLLFEEQCQYRVEYSNHQIVAQDMPTDTHELICGNAIWASKTLLFEQPNFLVYGSNLGIYIQATGAHYKPDAVVLAEEPQFIFHKVKKRTFRSVINPYAVVEVFSDGTIYYDQTEKLPNYKQCPSLQHIIYIHQHTPLVTVYTRTPKPNQWLSEDFMQMNDAIPFAGKEISLEQLYHQVVFTDRPPHPAR
jgi:Uma2 family endonuclease